MTPAEAGLAALVTAAEKLKDPSLREAARLYLGDLLVLEGRRLELGEKEFHRRRVALVVELAKLDQLAASEGTDL